MALSFFGRVPVTSRIDRDVLVSVSSPFGVVEAEDYAGSRCSYAETAVCLQGPILQARVSSWRQQESLSSFLSSSHQCSQSTNFRQGSPQQSAPSFNLRQDFSPTTHRSGNFVKQGRSNCSSLIDIEDGVDGSITFKYGPLEDLWDLDKLLGYLCRGAFSTYSVVSFITLVVEIFSFPVPLADQRKMVQLVSSHCCHYSPSSSAEKEMILGQLLAEAASEFLPSPNVGVYTKGWLRPSKRFSSRMDQWWDEMNNYFGPREVTGGILADDSFPGFDRYQMRPLRNYQSLNNTSSTNMWSPNFSQALPKITWKKAPAQVPWLLLGSADPLLPGSADRLEPSKTSSLEFVSEINSSGPSELAASQNLNFIWLSSQVDALEDVLKETEQVDDDDSNVETLYPPVFDNVETLPIASIQSMVQWLADDRERDVFATSFVGSPARKEIRVKTSRKRPAPRTGTKTTQRVRGNNNTKSAPKRRNTERRSNDFQLFDLFFGLPLSHKRSGVASFMVMRNEHSDEILTVLNQAAVGLAGAGLAVTLHVVARMLSVNSTFDSAKLFGLIRGVALLWLSAGMQSLRRLLLRLPPQCTDKEQLLCLQQRLRSLSIRALTVIGSLHIVSLL